MSTLSCSSSSESIACSYYNPSTETRLVRIANSAQWYFEGMVLPRQKLRFLAPPDAYLEVYVGEEVEGSPLECIACDRL
ncbi:MAG: DUF1830 domain-containing protein [Synechococcales cyanobacterium RM1_1_8]|nr:DUF1830 domain-containing protein [Synechococcales cyanobacterium RM1_1_8]